MFASNPVVLLARRFRLPTLTPIAAMTASLVFGQGAVPAPAPAPAQDEIVVLTPFEVDASGDSRYRAASTLAGSRLNSQLKDVAAIIDVYTKDFMVDLGATNLEDVLSYANNLENDTEDTVHGQGTLNISTGNSFRYRIRGLPASRARNYFDFDYPIDTYNTERLDESRGPNSILFGFGSPGGIVNVSTKKPLLTRNLAAVEFSMGTEIDSRATLDLNRVLADKRLALRFNGLYQEKTGWRKYTYEDLEAFHFAVAAKPWSKTLLNAEFERYLANDSVARPMTYWSHTDTWDAAGGPLLTTNFAGRTNATLNPGFPASTVANVSGQNYWVFTEQTGSFANWRGMSRSNRASYTAPDGTTHTAFGAFRDMVMSPAGIVEVNTLGPSTGRELELDAFFASLQHEFTDDLHLELALTKQYSDWRSRRLPSSTLFADPNAFLPAGGAASAGPAATNPAANPFAGGYYFETVAQFWRTTADTLNYRATASYNLDLGDRLGRHRFGLLLERDEYEIRTRTLQEHLFVNGALISTAPANAANQLRRRFYVTPGSAGTYRNADVLNPPVPLNVTLPDGTRLTSDFVQYTSAPADYTKTNDVAMLVVQSAWFSRRVNTIVGVRRDDVEFDDWGSYEADGMGGFARSPANRSIVKYKGNTRNAGIVYHLADWLSIFANYSTSVGVPGLKVIYAPNGNFMDPMEGEGTDFGLKFSIPRRRIEGTLTVYKATSTNETDNQNIEVWGVNGFNNFLDGLVGAGLMSGAQAEPLRARGTGDTVDARSEGIELSITGEIVRNWDVRFNYSYTDRSVSNAFPRVNAWAQETLRPFWQSWNRDNPNTPGADNILDTITSGTSTLRDLIDNFETNLETRMVARVRVLGLRPHKANLFTTYGFEEGAFTGLRVGGGIRYDAANFAGVGLNEETLRGRSATNIDLMASFRKTVYRHPVTFQLNVRNATRDDAKVGPSVINAAGTWESLIIQPPRQFLFTVRVRY